MKKLSLFLLVLTLQTALWAADKKLTPGPNGGRLLKSEAMVAEFLIQPDRTVKVTFYNAQMKEQAPMNESVTVLADAKTNQEKYTLEKSGSSLVSKKPLPEGEGYNLVVQVKTQPNAKPANFRFTMDLSKCGGCKLLEYACICGH